MIGSSQVSENGDYVWGRITSPGKYAIIGLNAHPLVIRTAKVAAPFIEDSELFERPIDVRFERIIGGENKSDNDSLLVLDFGRFQINNSRNIEANGASGKLWRTIL